jgi:Cytochrome c
MRSRSILMGLAMIAPLCGASFLGAGEESAAERGRKALTGRGYVEGAWSESAFAKAGKLWGADAPDPEKDLSGYTSAFAARYGLHPAPFPNNGLPMGLRKANKRDGTNTGLQIDCMVCHGGSIGGTSYVGLGNTQLDLKSLLTEMTIADGHIAPPSPFTLNSSRGTVNAGQVDVVLLSLRNPDLSWRKFPMLTGANLPELDVPAWWILGKKTTKYYDGRTDARSARSNMQFMLGELSLEQFQALEPTFIDIQAYLKSITPPKYPFAINRDKADRGEVVFKQNCTRCHGTYGPGGTYPNKIVPLDVIGTDPERSRGMSDRFVKHYNSTWFADYKVNEESVGYQAPPLDGIWATAPYLHNGSVPTLHDLLKSSDRPATYLRPPSTGFENYDQTEVGWKAEPFDPKAPPKDAKRVFDSSRWGLSNKGHTFGDKLTAEQRTDLIEYLKTL